MIQVSAHYNADPYNMLRKIKKMNLKNIRLHRPFGLERNEH